MPKRTPPPPPFEAAFPLASHLPFHLAERIVPLPGKTSRAGPASHATPLGAAPPFNPDGRFVLYWMRTAVRDHENPALDVARVAARALGLPLGVVHALSERYPYASDRHHTFILEGARDVQLGFAEQGIPYAFHLERSGHRGAHLKTLAESAALVVTELAPIPFLRDWAARLAASSSTPVWTVDAATLVGMHRVPKEVTDRAFRFRDWARSDQAHWCTTAWPALGFEHAAPSSFPVPLPFDPIDLSQADLAALVATCEIDHGVAPVPHTRGGSTSGYARWNAFLSDGIRRYHRDRNDPLRGGGVSRMSAYLHMGQVSPFRIAREATAAMSDPKSREGAEKYLDELLVWRELAHAFAVHTPEPDAPSAIPAWARATLARHTGDPRPALHSWETLARARTGDPLWDAAQRSLLIHGELHNNVRMTWGKALLSWTPDAEAALHALVDLNHRYALDGRDPNSYGGLLWCLGAFDRPFEPEQAVLGTVRPRDTATHMRRLDVRAYAAETRRPALARAPRVAVIGAGVSGLTVARTLQDHGLQVVVFDKGRGPGGRLSTRDTPRSQAGGLALAQEGLGAANRTGSGATGSGAWGMDHGAQYFTVRDPDFRRWVGSWVTDGIVAPWDGDLVRIAVGGGDAEGADRAEAR